MDKNQLLWEDDKGNGTFAFEARSATQVQRPRPEARGAEALADTVGCSRQLITRRQREEALNTKKTALQKQNKARGAVHPLADLI